MLIVTTTLPAEWQKTQRCGTEGFIIISHRAHDNPLRACACAHSW